jgi:hypothetical protein
MNTPKRLERLSTAAPYVKKINSETILCMQLKKEPKGIYRGYFQIFGNITKKEITYFEEIVDETTFEAEEIKDFLSKNFAIVTMIDPIREQITKETGRIFFVCKKKNS